jgi:hypothetical protein
VVANDQGPWPGSLSPTRGTADAIATSAYAGVDRESSRHWDAPDPMAEVPPAVIAERTMMAAALPIRMKVHNNIAIYSSRRFMEPITRNEGVGSTDRHNIEGRRGDGPASPGSPGCRVPYLRAHSPRYQAFL